MKSEDLQYSNVSNTLAKDVAERKYFENKFKNLENVLDNYDNLQSYLNIKDKIEKYMKNKYNAAMDPSIKINKSDKSKVKKSAN